MNAFVTGGTGFVGAHLVQALRARGDRVTALVRSPAKAQALGWTDVRIVRGDLHDRAALADGCADADVVYHVAGLIAARNYTGFLTANRDGTRRVQEAAEGAPRRPRLVLVSSQAVGGPNPRGMPTDESTPPAPVTDYGRSKLAAEDVVRSGKGPWAIVRPPVVYGERDTETLKLFRLAKLGLGAVFGDGGQELSVIYAGDLAQALIAAGTHPAALGGTYYACHPEVHTSRSLVLAIGRAVGKIPVVLPVPGPVARGLLWSIGSLAALFGRATILTADKANEFLAPAWTCRGDRLSRDTGWRAQTDLATGLAAAVTWYRTERWL
ncbi:MAG TPA: NAD(P)-dependent oxidoreductase [Gemmatimonadales bacterium]|nr:NAD(P)-dependent oxidoreductase [Gemmatimonadales bacterium]